MVFFFKLVIRSFLVVLGLHCCVGFSLVASGSYSLVVVNEFLVAVASLVAEWGL